jgi:uncharacterized protein YecE (DUF72 family)
MTDWSLGTMGFGFADWEGVFYPTHLPKNKYLHYYSQHFNSVELDTTFYGVPTVSQVKRWHAATPGDFTFSVKTPRQITHEARLVRAGAAWSSLLSNLSHFQDKLGVVLIQMPPDFTIAEWDALQSFIQPLTKAFRYAVEFRHPSWYQEKTAALLAEHQVAWAATAYLDLPATIYPTAKHLYFRWIGEHGRYQRKDHERVDKSPELQMWLKKIQPLLEDVTQAYGYFNNDYAGFSPSTCNRFKTMLGLAVSDFAPPRQERLF